MTRTREDREALLKRFAAVWAINPGLSFAQVLDSALPGVVDGLSSVEDEVIFNGLTRRSSLRNGNGACVDSK